MTAQRLARFVSIVVALMAMVPGPAHSAAAQDASPAASPEAADCTANLGLVRSTKACVAIVHASLDAPSVDVYLNGEVAVTALAPGSATSFVELPAGDYLVQIVPAGGTADQAFITVDPLTLEPAKAYEEVALGALVDTGPATETRVAVYDVTTYAVPPSGAGLPQARVRVVHAAGEGKPIDAALIADDIAVPLADDLEEGADAAYAERPAGAYRLTISAFWGELLLTVPEVMLEADTVTSIYVVWAPAEPSGLDVVIVTTAASRLPASEATPGASPTA